MNSMYKSAVISDCGTFRYLLSRVWDDSDPKALIVMLNPSTADAEIDDPTIKSCIRLLNYLGFGGFEVVNLFAFRATNPRELEDALDPIGQVNDSYILEAADRCNEIVCAWGASQIALRRASLVYGMLSIKRLVLHCFGTNVVNRPKHPLYLRTGTTLQEYNE